MKAREWVTGLLEDNGGCMLPCLWGISPEDEGTQKLAGFLAPLGSTFVEGEGNVSVRDFGDLGGVTLIFPIGEDLEVFLNFSYYLTGERIEQLVFSASSDRRVGVGSDLQLMDVFGEESFDSLVSYYTLAGVLTRYGPPASMLVAAFPDEPDSPPLPWTPFSVVLVYPSRGFLVEYVSPRESVGELFVGCPSEGHIRIATWDPRHALPLSQMIRRFSGPGIHELNMSSFRPLYEATSVSLEEYFKAFTRSELPPCLRTRAKLWQP